MNNPDSLSYWEHLSFWGNPDFTIIGGGIVGLSTALSLKEFAPKSKINIVERGYFPEGASTRNAGFACFGSISELSADLLTTSENEVFELVKMRYNGLKKLQNRLGSKKMDYKQYGGFEIFDNESDFEKHKNMISYFNDFLHPITSINKSYHVHQNKYGINAHKQMIVNTEEGQIDTGKTLKALISLAQKKHINIIYGLKIDKIETNNLMLENGICLKPGHIIVCTNGFARSLLPNLEVQPARNIVMVTEPIDKLKIKGAFHYQEGYYYFRNIGNRILIGGGRNEDAQNENTDDFGKNTIIEQKLKYMLHHIVLPNRKNIAIEYQWSGILGIGKSKYPIIQKINPNITVAVRMGGMGVAIGSIVGEYAAKIALN